MSRPPPRSTILTIGFISFLAGLALARRLAFMNWWFIFGSLAACCLFRRQKWFIVIAAFTGVLIGLARGQVFMAELVRYQALFHRQVVFVAQADNDAVYANQGQLTFDAARVRLQKPVAMPLAGKIRVTGLGATMVYRGDLVQVSGSLSPTQGSNQAKTSFAKLHILQRSHSPIDNLRRRFIAGLQSVLPEPEASFGAGLLIGQRSTIPKETNDQLSATGLTHLVAVSGYNLTIIIVAVRRLLGKASKFQSTVVAVALMMLFVLVTGFSASIVRAALVSSLSLLSWYYGRRFKPLVLISLAAAVTAFWNPFYLWSDIGWYLSFLAFFGVLLIAPVISRLLSPLGQPKTLGALLAETTAAQTMTLPIIMYTFGRLSVIGLVANLLVVPLVPLAMLLSLIAGLSGVLSGVLGGWIAAPAKLLLTYMIDLVGLLSRLPHASVQQQISLRAMIFGYAAILAAVGVLAFKKPRQKGENMLK